MSDIDRILSNALLAANVGSVRIINHAGQARAGATTDESLRSLATASAHALELFTRLQEAEKEIRALEPARLAS